MTDPSRKLHVSDRRVAAAVDALSRFWQVYHCPPTLREFAAFMGHSSWGNSADALMEAAHRGLIVAETGAGGGHPRYIPLWVVAALNAWCAAEHDERSDAGPTYDEIAQAANNAARPAQIPGPPPLDDLRKRKLSSAELEALLQELERLGQTVISRPCDVWVERCP